MPNLFSAFTGNIGRQEVVVHAPQHMRSIAELSDEGLVDVASAWCARAAAARTAGYGHVFAFLNEGRGAGASLPHTHSQLLWLPVAPPTVRRELPRQSAACAVCAHLRDEVADGRRVVLERDGILVLARSAPRGAYELLVAPLQCEHEPFSSRLLPSALQVTAEAVRRLRRTAGVDALNAWLHAAPFEEALHWRIEVLPRLRVAAGLELGADLYVSEVAPEWAAELLRAG